MCIHRSLSSLDPGQHVRYLHKMLAATPIMSEDFLAEMEILPNSVEVCRSLVVMPSQMGVRLCEFTIPANREFFGWRTKTEGLIVSLARRRV